MVINKEFFNCLNSDDDGDDCPLSIDGICESDDTCPYGCDEKYGDVEKEYEAQHLLHLQCLRSDYVYVILRLLVESGWINELERLNAPRYLIESHIESRETVRSFASEWMNEQFNRHWPEYQRNREGRDHFSVLAEWEVKLYSLYYSNLTVN